MGRDYSVYWINKINPDYQPFVSRLKYRQKRWIMGSLTNLYLKQDRIERLIGRSNAI